MLSSHISLGQLAIHSRLDRTLPCKLFESLALKLPYITGRNRGVREILVDKVNCIEINPGDSDDLSDKIVYLKNNPEMCSKIGDAGYDLYRNRLTSKILAQEVIDACFKLKQ
jgi:glycosyltransferase involved in cell wall biosynthesis